MSRSKKYGLWLLVFMLFISGWNSPITAAEDNYFEETPSDIIAPPSVTNDVYQPVDLELMANKTELTVYPGESYRFYNTATTSKVISSDGSSASGIVYDYVRFNANGEISGEEINHGGNVSLPKGYSAVFTVSGHYPVTFSLYPEVSYVPWSTPALHRVTLNQGQSYIFTNEGSTSQTLLSDASSTYDRRYDYAEYEMDGTLDSSDFNSAGKPSVGIGNELIVTGASVNPVTVGMPYDAFSAEYSAGPAYSRVTLGQGQSYQFTNISTKTDTLESDGSTSDKFDYVVYLPDGTESSRGTNTSSEPSVAAGRTAVITMVTPNPITFGVPYRTFDTQPTGGTAISRITVHPGDTYIFYNNGSLTNPIKNDAGEVDGLFDYVIYNQDGSISTSGFNKDNDPTIPSLGYAIVTVAGHVPVVFDYTNDFSVEPSAEPAFERVTLYKGESYVFRNISNDDEYLDSDASSSQGRLFDYVTYHEDGTERSRGQATSVEPKVFSKNRAVVTTVSDNPVTFGAIFTVFEGSGRPDEAISKITIFPGESYIFRNHGSLSNPIKNNASEVGGIFDYVMYMADNSLSSDGFNRTSDPNVPKQGYGIVTVAGTQPIVFDYTDDFTVEPSAEPAYLRVTLNKGESYAFTNISSEREYLDSNASLSGGRKYDYVTYYEDGSERTRRTGVTVDPVVYAKNKIVVTTASDEPVSFGGIYRVFRGQDDPGEDVEQLTIYPNESYVFHNTGPDAELRHNADQIGSFMDYAIYDMNGVLTSDGFNVSSRLELPSQSRTVISNPMSVPIQYEYRADIQAVVSAEPAFHRAILDGGQSYQFTNIGGAAKKIERISLTGRSPFSYVVYDASGVEIERRTDASIEPVLDPGQKVIVTVPSEQRMIFGAVYRLFRAEPAQQPGEKITVRKHESVIFTNPGSSDQLLKSNALQGQSFYDVAVYGQGNRSLQAQMDTTAQEWVVPGNSEVVVTVTSDTPVTFEYSAPITAVASEEQALLRKELAAGASGLFTNIGPSEGQLISNASHAQYRYYDYRLLDAAGNLLREETETDEPQDVPAGARIEVRVASSLAVLFAGPSRTITFTEVTDPFIDLIERQAEDVKLGENQKGYYRFRPETDGLYRFVVKENSNFEKEPQITLYSDAALTDALATTIDQVSQHGWDYTVLEWELKAGKVYYLTLTEKDGIGLEGIINSALMILAPENKYDYGAGNRLTKVILRTGDEILYEYDNNGNVTKRSKKVFPF